jgi:hypothetical protein
MHALHANINFLPLPANLLAYWPEPAGMPTPTGRLPGDKPLVNPRKLPPLPLLMGIIFIVAKFLNHLRKYYVPHLSTKNVSAMFSLGTTDQ